MRERHLRLGCSYLAGYLYPFLRTLTHIPCTKTRNIQFTLPFDDGVDQNYIYPQTLAKQLALYSDSSVWAEYDVDIDLNHDAYLNAVDYESAKANGWNGTGVPPGGKYWFQVSQNSERHLPCIIMLAYVFSHLFCRVILALKIIRSISSTLFCTSYCTVSDS